MSTDTEASAGAMRAAAECCLVAAIWEHSLTADMLAPIIDRETHVAELVEALETIAKIGGVQGEIARNALEGQ